MYILAKVYITHTYIHADSSTITRTQTRGLAKKKDTRRQQDYKDTQEYMEYTHLHIYTHSHVHLLNTANRFIAFREFMLYSHNWKEVDCLPLRVLTWIAALFQITIYLLKNWSRNERRVHSVRVNCK